MQVEFEVEVFRIDADGAMWFRMQARCAVTTPLAMVPRSVFRKLPDGQTFVVA